MISRIVRSFLQPSRIFLSAWRAIPLGSLELRLQYDVFRRPHYAYCIYQAALLAHRLGVKEISVLEFGVAGGNGLVEVEELALQVEDRLSPRIQVYGFDTGTGLPPPVDYRDLPYLWREGFFQMDEAALKRRLHRAKLVIGNVAQTVPKFLEEHSAAPVGAIMVDLDYYSSTADALRILTAPPQGLLPRVYCYFDDVMSSETGILCDHVGQLLAIREYNEKGPMRKLAPIAGFGASRYVRAPWNEQIYVHHAFDHPHYNDYVHPDVSRQLPLR